jgi:hypothetical protein
MDADVLLDVAEVGVPLERDNHGRGRLRVFALRIASPWCRPRTSAVAFIELLVGVGGHRYSLVAC